MNQRSTDKQEEIDRKNFRRSRTDPEVLPHKKKPHDRAICKKSPTREHDYTPDPDLLDYPWMRHETYTCSHCGKGVWRRKKPEKGSNPMMAIHCDGPECDTFQRDDIPNHGFITTHRGNQRARHFCCNACATRYFAKLTKATET